MSSLKYQLRELLPSLSKEANKVKDQEIKSRLYLIKAVCESEKDVKKSCEARGISTDFFYKWGGRLLKYKTLSALKPESKAPKKFWNLTSGRISAKAISLKKKYPFYGQERVSFYLKFLFNIICAPSTVYGILKRAGLVAKEYRQRRTKKHFRRYRRPITGYLQMDIKYVPYRIEGAQYYEFNIVDHCTSWRLIRAYRNKGVEELKCFLAELTDECPFPIFEIQTDNGKEFTDKYSPHLPLGPSGDHYLDMWCGLRDIRHRLIPVGEKELNGKVENTHKYDDEEFYSQKIKVLTSFGKLERSMKTHNRNWNERRHTKTLSWRTPNETITHVAACWLAYVASVKKVNLSKPENGPEKIEKPKKLTSVDRYLQWMAWDERKYKSFIPVPLILKIFPKILSIDSQIDK